MKLSQTHNGNIYLSPERIEELCNFDLDCSEVLLKVHKIITKQARQNDEPCKSLFEVMDDIKYSKDIFVLGCLTGQYAKDLIYLSDNMITSIKGIDFIMIPQSRLKRKVYIPFNGKMKEIIDRYNGTIPKKDLNTIDQNIRLIGELIGWTSISTPSDSSMSRTRYCDLLTYGTARLSYGINSYLAGKSISSIMNVTGHKTEVSFRKFLNISTKQN